MWSNQSFFSPASTVRRNAKIPQKVAMVAWLRVTFDIPECVAYRHRYILVMNGVLFTTVVVFMREWVLFSFVIFAWGRLLWAFSSKGFVKWCGGEWLIWSVPFSPFLLRESYHSRFCFPSRLVTRFANVPFLGNCHMLHERSPFFRWHLPEVLQLTYRHWGHH